MGRRIFLAYPSGRPSLVKDAVKRAQDTASHPVFTAVGLNGDRACIPALSNTVLLDFGPDLAVPGSFVKATNLAYRVGVAAFPISPSDLVGFWSDDFYPEKGWDDIMFKALEDTPAKPFLYPNDKMFFPNTEVITVPFATRKWWDEKNGRCIWPPMYTRAVCDNDITLRAELAGEIQLLNECVIYHKHALNNGRERDWLDLRGDPPGCEDRALFNNVRRPAILASRDNWVTW